MKNHALPAAEGGMQKGGAMKRRKEKRKMCRAFVLSEYGREYCQGSSGHKTHWYKIYSTGQVIHWEARGPSARD